MRSRLLVVALVAFACVHPAAVATPQTLPDAESACALHQVPASCVQAGLAYRFALGVPRDAAKAKGYFHTACARKDQRGCRNEGELAIAVKDWSGWQLIEKACDGGDVPACRMTGEHTVDKQAASRLFQKACAASDARACRDEATLMPEEAALRQKACDLGDPGACNSNDPREPELERKACDDGDPYWCLLLKTPESLQRACDLQDDDGCAQLADAIALKEPARAEPIYKRLCDAGRRDACPSYEKALEETAPEQALAIYEQRCDGKDLDGCHHGASLAGHLAPPSPAKMASFQMRACDLGDMNDCRRVAAKYPEIRQRICEGPSAEASDCVDAGQGAWTGASKDADARALADLVRACSLGSGEACADAALDAEETGDVARVIALDEHGCIGSGDKASCYQLERVLADVRALPSDKDAARLDGECAKGKAASCTTLGLAYEYGRGVAGSQARATQLLAKACDANDVAGCYRLGALHGDESALKKACDGKSAAGCAFLSLASADHDDARAAACKGGFAVACWLEASDDTTAAKKACEGKDAVACHVADTGDGVLMKRACELEPAIDCGATGEALDEKEEKKAIALFERGCKAGDVEACSALIDHVDEARGKALRKQIDDAGGTFVDWSKSTIGGFGHEVDPQEQPLSPPYGHDLGHPRHMEQPKITFSTPTASDGLDAQIIRRYVRQRLPQILYCYQKQLVVNPSLKGSIVVEYAIDPNGRPVTVNMKSGFDDTVSSCVVEVFKQIEYPKPEGGKVVNVSYPMAFSQAE
jgi:TPR repeat protein